jgi:hypothetical protein
MDYKETKGKNISQHVSSEREKKIVPHSTVECTINIYCNVQACTKRPISASDVEVCFTRESKVL